MKRIYVLGLSVLFSGTVFAQTDRNELPERSSDFINQHFASERIASVDVDDNWYNMSDSETYEVELENGVELDFNKKGELTEIETEDRASIPMSVFPDAVRSQLERDYANAEVVAWEKDKKGHQVELRDGREVWYDNNGKMKKKKDHKKKDHKNKNRNY